MLSFNGNKILTTGAGGAIILKDKKFIKKPTHFAQYLESKITIGLMTTTTWALILECQV